MELYAGLIEFNWTLVFIWLTVITLYFIMKHFFFEKVHNFMVARENAVKESFENAEQVNLLANEKMDKYDKKIAELESEGREIIRNAKIKADQRAESIIDETNVKVEQMLKRAQEEIDREKAKAIVEMREQIAAMAIFAAEKIIERQLDMSGQEELLAGILDEAGRVSWRN
ncbi:MAG TPA: F0F1 ATP synthase subunit B [Bacillota bacterium]|nr:F0F1 ATP synthase subunit B [Bacillota bacterium]